MRKLSFLSCLVLLMHTVTWVPAASRLLDSPSSPQLGTLGIPPKSSQPPSASEQGSQGIEEVSTEMASYRGGVNQLGSSPPNCEHKCDGCNPCVAIHVPTITGHYGVQYANYEPESWKCKCGPRVYSP